MSADAHGPPACAEEKGHTPYVFGGSSPGAASSGHVRLRPV